MFSFSTRFLPGTLNKLFFLRSYINLNIYETEEVGNVAAFLASPLASAITGSVVYVDNGLNAMGVGVDSPIFENLELPKEA